MQWISIAVVLVYLVGLVLLANQLDGRRFVQQRQLVLAYPYRYESTDTAQFSQQPARKGGGGVLLLMQAGLLMVLLLSAGGALSSALSPELAAESSIQVDLDTALTVSAVGLIAAGLCAAVMFSHPVREWLAARLGGGATFNPDSYVHRTALVLAVAGLAYTTMELLIAGGVAGLAENLEAQSPGAADAVVNLALMVVLAFLGVGLVVRRTWTQATERLALRIPTFDDVLWGVGTAFACLVLIFVFSATLTFIFSPEALQEQGAASDQIARALGNSLFIVFLAAFSAAVGEEILFRGALQPVFGLIPTTLFFALLHSQYAFTPGSAAILVVGGAFGVLKQRQSTTAAIIAHFTYNFVLLGLAYVYIRLEEAGLLPEATEGALLLVSTILPISF